MDAKDTPRKRLGIFVFFDKDGYVGKYIDNLLSDMSQNLDDLVIVCNGILSDDGYSRLSVYTDKIFIRENKGFDGTAWKVALSTIGWENVAQYGEIVFFNDICYGPLYPLKKVFDVMSCRHSLDFWGITRHYKAADFGYFSDGVLPEHIQTYFFVVRNPMLKSNHFKTFWEKMPEIKNFHDDIGLFEARFTQYFSSRGFSWDTYINMKSLEGSGLDNYCYNYELPYVLISEFDMPFVRRKSLTQFTPNSCAGPEKDARRVLKYISTHTTYDVSVIWEDLLRKNNVSDLYSRLHLDYILPTDAVIFKPLRENKIALLIHIYYEDQITYCLQFAQSIPEYTDVYITTIANNKDSVEKAFTQLNCNKLDIRIVKNRGRDMSALYVGCHDVLQSGRYDYVCVIHDKKSPQVGLLFGMAFRDLTFENMLASKEYVENIIGTLDREPQLGLLGFPIMIGGPYWPVLANTWASIDNFKNTQKLLERCGVKQTKGQEISTNKPPIVYANVFWCRPEAIKPLVDLQLKYEDFNEEPLPVDGTFSHAMERAVTYTAQNGGYYSGVLYTDEYASIYIPALMIEYSRNAISYVQVDLKATKESDVKNLYANTEPDLSFYPVRVLLKNMVKRALKPYPRLYKFAAARWWGLKRKYHNFY